MPIVAPMKARIFYTIVLCLTASAIPAMLSAQDLSNPASLDCSTLAAESASLKAELKANGGRTVKSAKRQGDAQKVTAIAGLAGQALAPVAGIIGDAVSEIAVEVQRVQVNRSLAKARDNLSTMMALSRRVQALEAERSRRCPKESIK